MHGKYSTLKEIVLELQPDPVGLHCNEQLDSSEEEVDELATQATQQLTQAYQIVTCCGVCNRSLRLVVQCTGPDINNLHTLLLGTLNLVCPLCAPKT
uniref:Protein E7 n=1 Tax=Human papillomavirus type 74 TaxID=44028 RepID=Q98005_HPV74|nr:E7 protein [human papillomavirus 74]WAB53817.1 E7 [human papillomavirus 74]WAB53911.1 E7 [human papillomavirus 74]WAB54248.1 E7 [human papillomavirus 74]WAB54539.1 E7 [human papillomavirus 74]